jgi:hypothetical protein
MVFFPGLAYVLRFPRKVHGLNWGQNLRILVLGLTLVQAEAGIRSTALTQVHFLVCARKFILGPRSRLWLSLRLLRHCPR